eukprot:4412344-Amphidinium_carterae.2
MVKRAHQVIHIDEVQVPAAPAMPNLITQQTLTRRFANKNVVTFLFWDGCWGVGSWPPRSLHIDGNPDVLRDVNVVVLGHHANILASHCQRNQQVACESRPASVVVWNCALLPDEAG